MNRRSLLQLAVAAAAFPAFTIRAKEDLTALAKVAYTYAYPMVKNYLTLYQYALEPGGSQYKGPLNTLNSVARVYTPDDTGIITPNSDTPYSFLVMDLRAEPLVVTLPPTESNRYYSMQLVDLYTHNVDYLGTRTDGNEGGNFMIAGPTWRGDTPAGIKRVIQMPTEIGLGLIRTQLFSPSDINKVKQIQDGYKVESLSRFKGVAPAPVAATLEWPAISDSTMDADFWSLTAFLLQFAPPLPWEVKLRESFSKLGVRPGSRRWPSAGFSQEDEVKSAGLEAHKILSQQVLKLTTSANLFGTPDEMKGKYTERALGALGGIYGNSAKEALYPTYLVDAQGQLLDTSKHRYALRFTRETLPPVGAFWSITMYDGISRLLVNNPLKRYLINSSMLGELKENQDGEMVIYLQHDNPGSDRESNWLPAPNGPMGVVMRLYLPKPEALDGRWTPPQIESLA